MEKGEELESNSRCVEATGPTLKWGECVKVPLRVSQSHINKEEKLFGEGGKRRTEGRVGRRREEGFRPGRLGWLKRPFAATHFRPAFVACTAKHFATPPKIIFALVIPLSSPCFVCDIR